MADVSVRRSEIQGRGVFVERTFHQGDMVLEIDDSDPVLDRGELTPEQEIFIDVFVGADGRQKITWMKAPERFINHSCDPNSFVRTDMATGVRKVWAWKDIGMNGELTWDYTLNIEEAWVAPVPCHCGARNCRGMIQGNFFMLPRKDQRRYLPILDEPFKRRFAREIGALGLSTNVDTS